MEEPKYLQHLEGAIPAEAFGYTISSYSMALEGWRRGLTLKFINKNQRKSELVYSLSDGNKEHVFSVARGDMVPIEAIKTCMNKDITKEVLMKNNVPTPIGKVFEETTGEKDYLSYGKEIGYPLVIKPVDGTAGKGVITGIETEKELLSSIKYLKDDLKVNRIIIENYVPGNDYRLYVLGDKVIGAFTRDRANVIGDGKSTIKKLVQEKNKVRAANPALKGKSEIHLKQEAKVLLKELNYDVSSVPKRGEKVYLNTANNVSSGGDPTDVTDLLNEKMKQIAVDAAKSVPGLVQGGVDLIIDENQTRGHVLEINSRPHIRAHLYPMQGIARDIPKEIIDFYFPETKSVSISNSLYFDFDLMYTSFTSGYCDEYTITKHPIGDVKLTRYEIKNVSNKGSFAKWCQENAQKSELHGYVKNIESNRVSLVMAGNMENMENFMERLVTKYPSLECEEKSRKTPVKSGFMVIGMEGKRKTSTKKQTQRTTETVTEIVKIVNTNDPNIDGYFPINMNVEKTKRAKPNRGKTTSNTKPKREKITSQEDPKKDNEKIKNSTSWKITKPLRVLGEMRKKGEK